MRWIVLITLVLLACDDGDPPPTDGDADGDVDGDSDGDADGDGDVGPEDCPRNSGWPCTCDTREGCDDGSPCAAAPGMTEGLGVCTALCDPEQAGTSNQCPADAFSGMGLCRLSSSPWGDPTHCLNACAHDVNCPSDQRCAALEISTDTDFCIP